MATGSDAAADLTIRAVEYAFEAPDRIPAGLVSATLTNEGEQAHLVSLARLKGSATPSAVTDVMLANGDPSPLLDYVGGAGELPPGARQQVFLSLDPGRYVLLCSLRTAEGRTHFSLGQHRPLEVAEAAAPAAAPPAPDVTVSLRDFAFIVPSEIGSGKQVWQVRNDGTDDHELLIVRPAAGMSYQDVFAYYNAGAVGSSPAISAGGLSRLAPGRSGWAVIDLPPGTYAMTCRIANAATGKIHTQLGMIRQFQLP
jgi:hypothetical protein